MVFLRHVLRFFTQRLSPQPRENEILFLVDLENISINFDLPTEDPLSYSLSEAFDKIIEQLVKTGRVGMIFAFASQQSTVPLINMLYTKRLHLFVCPKVVIDKVGPSIEKKDTVDARLIEVGRDLLSRMPSVTHLCLGSGDGDFVPFVIWAKHQGLKIIIAAGNRQSLARELAELADKDSTGKPAIYFFSPTITA